MSAEDVNLKGIISRVAREVSFAVEFGEVSPDDTEDLLRYAYEHLASLFPEEKVPDGKVCPFSLALGAAMQAGLMRRFDLVQNDRYFG